MVNQFFKHVTWSVEPRKNYLFWFCMDLVSPIVLICPLFSSELCKIFSNRWTCLEVKNCVACLFSALFVCSSSRIFWRIVLSFQLIHVTLISLLHPRWKTMLRITLIYIVVHLMTIVALFCSSLIVLFLAFSIHYFDYFHHDYLETSILGYWHYS